MALKGFVTKLSDKLATTLSLQSAKTDRGPWQPGTGPYPLLLEVTDEDLKPLVEKSGVFVLWHRGVRPQWVFAGVAHDVAAALAAARVDSDIEKYALNDGVYVSWALLPLEECPGVVLYLRNQMQPAVVSGPLVEMMSPPETPAELQPEPQLETQSEPQPELIPQKVTPTEFPLPAD